MRRAISLQVPAARLKIGGPLLQEASQEVFEMMVVCRVETRDPDLTGIAWVIVGRERGAPGGGAMNGSG